MKLNPDTNICDAAMSQVNPLALVPEHVRKETIKSHALLHEIMAADGHSLIVSGETLKCCCPFHRDHTPSLVVYLESNTFNCFGCGVNGDVITYAQLRDKCDFPGALDWLENWFLTHPSSTPIQTSPRPKEPKKEYVLTAQEREVSVAACRMLENNPDLCSDLITARQWDAATIRTLASQGHLGWYQGRLAYVYTTGIKVRGAGHEFWWPIGATSLWRWDRIESSQQGSRSIICEGESDAITLISQGWETINTSIVALPGATTVNVIKPELFRGKDVTLAFDNDPAGEDATRRVTAILHGVASIVRQINWKGVAADRKSVV